MLIFHKDNITKKDKEDKEDNVKKTNKTSNTRQKIQSKTYSMKDLDGGIVLSTRSGSSLIG
jgi:hypothetical protein